MLGCLSLLLPDADSVDKRGRHVNMTSSEDLRKYYDLDGEPATPLIRMKATPPQRPDVILCLSLRRGRGSERKAEEKQCCCC